MNDLELVRSLAAEPTDESVSRTWYRIARLQTVAPVGRTRRLVPVFSGLAVVAVLAVAVAFLGGSGGPTVGQWPVGAAPEAVVSLNSMAELVEAQPETPKPGRYVRTEVSGWAGRCGVNGDGNRCEIESQPRDWVFDLDTGELPASSNSLFELFGGKPAQGQTPPLEQTGIGKPTRAWLDSLPTDPAKLLERLRTEVGENKAWSVDHMVWDAVAQLYAYTEAALTPARRAALLRALALTEELSTRTLIVDGVHLVAIRHIDKNSGTEIIFNPGTARAVGRANAFLAKGLTVVQADGGPTLPPGIVYQATWKQEVTRKA